METSIFFFIIAGFVAQLIDGTLGMGYGVACTTLLLSLGIPPATASASVHNAKLFTCFTSAACHVKCRNIDKSILLRLVVPGMIGGACGACVVSSFPGEVVKPWISVYLLAMGIVIIGKAVKKAVEKPQPTKLGPLGLFGGFVDAVGGGGWGPVVTSTLVAKGNSPRYVVGTVNTAEFFVALATSAAFFIALGHVCIEAVIGLVIGGVLAAPIAALACNRLQPKPLMVAVGVTIVLLSARTLHQIPGQIATAHSALLAGLNQPHVH